LTVLYRYIMGPIQRRILSVSAGCLLLALFAGLLLCLMELLQQGYLSQKMFRLAALSLRHWLNASLLVFLVLLPVCLFVAMVLKASRERLVQLGAGFVSISFLLFSGGMLLHRVTHYPLPPVLRYLRAALSDAGKREVLQKYLADYSAKNPGFIHQAVWGSIGILLLFLVVLVLFLRLDWDRIARPFRGDRIRRAGFVLAVLLLCLNVAVLVDREAFKAKGPDIVLIYLDALRSDHLGCNGYPRDTSPFIDRLAGEGARFANVVSQASSTFPSVHSALTSKVASHFLDANACLPPRHLTLAECLKNRGYATVGISSSPVVTKSNTAYSLGGFEQGFDVYDESIAYGEAWNWQWRSPEGVIEKALDAIEQADRPLFLFLYIMDPHSDYRCPEPFNSRFDPGYSGKEAVEKGQAGSFEERTLSGEDPGLDEADIRHLVALYDGEIAYADSQVGRLVERLREKNRLDDTILVLTSDHGEEFLEHGGVQHGHTLYNEVIRVPLIIRYPPRIPEGTVLERRIVQSLDMTPTLLDLADITIPAEMQGESLMPLVQDSESPRREFAVSESPFADLKAVVTGKWKYIYTSGTRPLKPSLRSAQAPGGRLYDLEQDPGELRDVSSEHPEIAAGLHAALLDALPESERERLAAQKDLQIHPDVREQLKSLGYLQ
jgi:arylsulfatase A-like enzyme